MLQIRLNSLDINVPESFDDISLEDYCYIFYDLLDNEEDESKITLLNEITIISRLLKIEEDMVKNFNFALFNRLRDLTKFIYDDTQFHLNKKNKITLPSGNYYIPNVNTMSLRQWIDTDMITQEKKNPKQFLELLASLLVKEGKDEKGNDYVYDGKYEQRLEELKNITATEGLGMLYFFFYKGEILRKVTKDYSIAKHQLNQFHQNIENLSIHTIGCTSPQP